MITELRSKSQITLPSSIIKELDLKTGDKIELTIEDGRIVITPVITVPKSQAWYWSKKWQDMEKQADTEREQGKIKKFDNIDDLLEDLDS